MNMVYPVYVFFNRFIWHKTKNKNEKHFCRYCLQCCSSKKILQVHKKVCFKINGILSVKLRDRKNKFQNYFKQLAVSFDIYADFGSALKGVQSDKASNAFYNENISRTYSL